jgi:signal transduction histidine kinase/ligand-binding sensor domain-containing protein
MNTAHAGKQKRLSAARLLELTLCLTLLLFSLTNATPVPPPLPNTGVGTPTEQNTQPAQPPSLHQWGAVTLFHGLPSDRVRAVAQDTEGVMWFGTDAGLARYDGRRTQTVNAAGLPQGRVLALKLDRDGALWVGTEGGAARLNGGEFQPVAETNGKAVTAIITPERGRALMASESGVIFDCIVRKDNSLGVRVLPPQPLLSADVDHPGPLNLTGLAFNQGMLYAGSLSRGLLTVEGDAFKEIQARPRAYFIQAIEEDAQGTLWFGAKAKKDEGGLYQSVDALRPLKVAAETGAIVALRADASGGMWVGTEAQGAFHYGHNSRLIEHFTFEGTAGGLRSDHIYSIFIDREDVVWFGTDKGVCRYDPHALRVENISDERESNFARAIYRTSAGRLLCGTNNGLFIRDDASKVWRPLSDLAHKIIYAITEAPDGRLLIGTANGLYTGSIEKETPASEMHFARIGPEDASDENSQSNNSVRSIALFRGAIYIAAFGRGVERLDGSKLSLVWPTADQRDARLREVVSLHAEGTERLWTGTASAGVFLFDGQGAQTLAALAGLNGAAVWSIDGSLQDAVWLATARGLYLYQSGQLKQLVMNTDARGVIAIEPGGNSRPRAWCATAGGGLLKIFMDQQFGPLISRLDAEQGLPSQSVFAILPERTGDARQAEGAAGEESLLIGTTRGIARYEAGRIEPALTPTRIISKRIHQPEELRAGLRLEYPQNSLVLDVTATSSRTFPEQFQYGFLLYDGAGRLIKQKLSHDAQLTMEGLRPGKYKVIARAFTMDLVASSPFSFEFDVAGAPFPWTTAALSVLLALALIALFWGYWQNRKIARTSAALMDANHQLAGARLQLANETEAERRRIARDLHDQTLADLRNLILLTDQLPANGARLDQKLTLDPATFRAEIESISQEVRRICEDLSPSVLENVGLTAALEWALANALAHSAPDCKFEYEFSCEDDLEEHMSLAPNVQMQIYRIAQEALNNICRHAAAKVVRLNVSATPDGIFLLKIEDDGRDFDPQDKKRKGGRGLANIRARASLIEAEVSWTRRTGGGTLFTLRKPNAVERQVGSMNAEG